MDNALIKQINALAKKEREEGLTKDERQLQQKLREQYLNQFRSQFKQHLSNITVMDEKGNDVTPEKLKKAKQKQKMNQGPIQ